MFNTSLNAIVTVAVALALLVVMPLALRLIDAPGVPVLARWWIPLGVPALVAMALPRGPLATALASVYLLATLALAASAVGRFLRNRRIDAIEVAAFTALVTPSIAASALAADRAGYQLFGFGLGILRLTVPHMHFAGCVAALIAGLASRAASDRRTTSSKTGTAAALAVPLGTGVVLVGYFVGDAVELLGALILTAGMWLTAWLTLAAATATAATAATATAATAATATAATAATATAATAATATAATATATTTARTAAMSTGTATAATPTITSAPATATAAGGNGNAGGGGTTRALLRASAATLSVTMVLAVVWAAGEATGLPHPSLTWMAATHGLANAFGFALCAALAWRRLAVSPL